VFDVARERLVRLCVTGWRTRYRDLLDVSAAVRVCPHGADDFVGLFEGLDSSPLMRRLGSSDRKVGEPIFAWHPKVCITGSASLDDLDEAQRCKVTQGWVNGLAMNAVPY
jgi:hypothetical protein